MFNLSSRDRHDLHISSWSRLASFHLHLRHQSPTFHGTVVALFHMALPHLISRADDYNIVHLLSSVRISLQLLRAHREMPFSDPSPSVLSTLPTRRDMLTWAVYVLSAVFDLSSSMISWGVVSIGIRHSSAIPLYLVFLMCPSSWPCRKHLLCVHLPHGPFLWCLHHSSFSLRLVS